MEELMQEVSDKISEANYHLWQSLITVNSLLASLLIALAAFTPLTSNQKQLVVVGFALSTFSCVALIMNFANTKEIYHRIFKYLEKGDLPDKKTQDKESAYAVQMYKQSTAIETWALGASVAVWIIIVIVVYQLVIK